MEEKIMKKLTVERALEGMTNGLLSYVAHTKFDVCGEVLTLYNRIQKHTTKAVTLFNDGDFDKALKFAKRSYEDLYKIVKSGFNSKNEALKKEAEFADEMFCYGGFDQFEHVLGKTYDELGDDIDMTDNIYVHPEAVGNPEARLVDVDAPVYKLKYVDEYDEDEFITYYPNVIFNVVA